jgi:hypothetical protein
MLLAAEELPALDAPQLAPLPLVLLLRAIELVAP